jgi:hypothetical protein
MGSLAKLLSLAGALAGLAAAPAAHAMPVVSLVFRASGTSSVTLGAGESAIADLILVSDVPLVAATLMLRTDNALARVVDARNTPAPFLGFTVTSETAGDGGSEIGTFGGLSFDAVGPVRLVLGDLELRAGSEPGETTIRLFRRDAIDVWYDAALEAVEPALGTAVVTVVPEPDTAALLVAGLALLAARRRAR